MITISNCQRTRKINRRLLKQIITALLADLEVNNAELGVVLVAAPEMTRLNERFLRHAGPTDVITFDYESGALPFGSFPVNQSSQTSRVKPEPRTLHGEMFLCVDEAVRQARRFGTSWQSELARYLVHGVLHLSGFRDTNAGAWRKMKREENRRLQALSRRFTLSKL